MYMYLHVEDSILLNCYKYYQENGISLTRIQIAGPSGDQRLWLNFLNSPSAGLGKMDYRYQKGELIARPLKKHT